MSVVVAMNDGAPVFWYRCDLCGVEAAVTVEFGDVRRDLGWITVDDLGGPHHRCADCGEDAE